MKFKQGCIIIYLILKSERSSKINKCRLDKMNVRFELLSKLKMEIKDQLSNKITNQALYRELMK